MKFKHFILFLLVFVSSQTVFGQTFTQFMEYGDEKMKEGDYIEALLYYEKAMALDSGSVDILWKYAEANRYHKNYKTAEIYYKRVFNLESARIYPMSIFWLATMQHYNGKYDWAARSWKSAKKVYKRDRDSYLYQKSVQELKSCLWAQRAARDTANLDLSPIDSPVNSKDAELAPVMIGNRLIFTSLKADSVLKNEVVIAEDYSLQLYQAEKKGDGFSEIKPLKGTKEKGYHSVNGTVSLDGKRFYFTRCDQSLNCKIYVGKIDGDKVTDIDSLGEIINYEFATRTTMPHIASIDGQEVLFFVSDRDFSFGGLDIWYSVIEDGNQYSLPENLGEGINTPDDDISPYYDTTSNRLYFSSSWYPGFGGQDIFYAEKKTEAFEFAIPQNAGLPTNSSKNDTYFVKDNEGNAYFSSNREGVNFAKNPTCCNDIFVIKKEEEPVSERFSNLEELNKKLPVTLYFHNDEPNPRNTDTITRLNYKQTYDSYLSLIPKYKKEYSKGLFGEKAEEAKEDISDFFVEYVEQGCWISRYSVSYYWLSWKREITWLLQ